MQQPHPGHEPVIPQQNLLNSLASGLSLQGEVRVRIYTEDGLVSDQTHSNTATDWARAVLSQLLMTVANGENTTTTKSRPLYIALGTGTGISSRTDVAMFAETYATRKPITYTSAFQPYTSQFTVNYLTTDPDGTYFEAGLWDSDVSTTELSASSLVGATSISVPSTAPTVYGSIVAGQYNTIYIEDGANSEYASIATTTNQGATTWALQSGLKYAHASGVTITAFTGNLWAHVVFSGAGETKTTGQALVAQWSVKVNA